MKFTILGARGSLPVSGREYIKYGGCTSSYLLQTEDQAVFIDAGTGIINAPQIDADNIHVLISHPHLDHLSGLPFFSPLLDSRKRVHLYMGCFSSLSPGEILDRLYSPPLWPLKLTGYPAELIIHQLQEPFCIGSVNISFMQSAHPGGSHIFRLEHSGRSLVLATDFEHLRGKSDELSEFARNTDLLLYDGQYTDADYEKKKGFGHSTAAEGISIARRCGAKRLVIIHHDVTASDSQLDQYEKQLQQTFSSISFGKCMDILEL